MSSNGTTQKQRVCEADLRRSTTWTSIVKTLSGRFSPQTPGTSPDSAAGFGTRRVLSSWQASQAPCRVESRAFTLGRVRPEGGPKELGGPTVTQPQSVCSADRTTTPPAASSSTYRKSESPFSPGSREEAVTISPVRSRWNVFVEYHIFVGAGFNRDGMASHLHP